MVRKNEDERIAFLDCLACLGCFLSAALGLAFVAGADHPGMVLHGALLLISALVAAGFVLSISFDKNPPSEVGYMDGPIKVATIASIV